MGNIFVRSKLLLAAYRVLMLSVFVYSVSFAASAGTAMDNKDLAVGMRTLPLLTNKITGTAKVAIVYDPNSATSKSEAGSIKAMIDGDFQAPGDLKLVSVMLPVGEAEHMAGSKIAIITSGLGRYYDIIGATAAANGVLTMTTDLSCVKANKCILGIVSDPSVDIYYSKPAADATKISFTQAFTMLVKQIE